MSPDTPYRSLLVFHGTGTGKTCAGITVAEALKSYLQEHSRKVIVIAPKAIIEGWKREIYSLTAEQQEQDLGLPPGSKQCTGSEYYLSPQTFPDPIKRERRLKKNISKYYHFFGVNAFKNYVDAVIKPHIGEDLNKVFSDTLFIIDEAHGLAGEEKRESTAEAKAEKRRTGIKLKLKSDTAPGTKKPRAISKRGILEVLHEVFKQSKNTRLLLLTATPIRDNATQLVDILNLLRMNEFKTDAALVKEDLLFPRANEVNEEYLLSLTKGYVSYLRGDDPIAFPVILDPPQQLLYEPSPSYAINGEPLSEEEIPKKKMNLVRCPMSLPQYQKYLEVVTESEKPEVAHSAGLQVSSVVYPVVRSEGELSFGNPGFEQFFQRHEEHWARDKKKHIYFSYPAGFDGAFAGESLKELSSKYWQLLQDFKLAARQPGIIYVYSDYVETGTDTMAIALEEFGFVRYTNDLQVQNGRAVERTMHQLLRTGKPLDGRCSVCFRRSSDHAGEDHRFNQATYLLFSGSGPGKEEDASAIVTAVLNDPRVNLEGQRIRVVLGSRVSGEGINFKRVRQVHIMTPWHNNTRLFQAIGRGARFCSHVDLPVKDRNVTVFKYSASVPEDAEEEENTETVDEAVYRTAMLKDLFVKKVERLMKENAVDCAFNKAMNVFPQSMFRSERDGSRLCDYTKCDYDCKFAAPPPGTFTVNTDTYRLFFARPIIEQSAKIIATLFKSHVALSLKDIVALVKETNPEIETQLIYEAIDLVIGHPPERHPMLVRDRFSRPGKVIYDRGFYVFQPDVLEDQRLPMFYRETPLRFKPEKVKMAAAPKAETGRPVVVRKLDQEKVRELIKVYGERWEAGDHGHFMLIVELGYDLDRQTPETQQFFFEELIRGRYNRKMQSDVLRYYQKMGMSAGTLPEVIHRINQPIGLYRMLTPNGWEQVSAENPRVTPILASYSYERGREALIFGFLAFKPDGSADLKIRDATAQVLQIRKATAKEFKAGVSESQLVSRRSMVTGQVCSTITIGRQQDIAEKIGLDTTLRGRICQLLELQLRQLDFTESEGLRHFFYPLEEAVATTRAAALAPPTVMASAMTLASTAAAGPAPPPQKKISLRARK
ncbi:MAG: DEAD/DEAH box helicase [Sulfobacillus sp.]